MLEIGVDIIEVKRFKELDYYNHDDFYRRIFTPLEIKYCLSFKNPEIHFATTFAGKEAVFKAVNKFSKVKINEIEIIREKGAPKVTIKANQAETRSEKIFKVTVKISLSHTAAYAAAVALASIDKKENISNAKWDG